MNLLGTRSWTLAGNGRDEFHQVIVFLSLRGWLKTCLCDMFGDWYICTTNEVDGDKLSTLLKEIKLDVHDNIDLIPWGNFIFTVYNLSCFEKGLLTHPIEQRDWNVGG
jgi:hypothetical protein